MTHEEKIKYMDIALRCCRFYFKEQEIDLFVSLYDFILGKEGKADINGIASIEVANEEKYKTSRP